jgi:uncharacterized protein YkwD
VSTRPRSLLVLVCFLAAVAAVGVVPASVAGSSSCTAGSDWGSPRQDLAASVVNLVNKYRAGLGLGPLKVSPTLTSAALWKARHMAKYNYFGHDDPAPPVARTPFQRMQACGYPVTAEGENIAYGYPTPDRVMEGWINSPGHRANLQAKQWAAIGVGAAQNSRGLIFWVQDFGAKDDSNGSGFALGLRDDRRVLRKNHKMWIRVLKNDVGDGLELSGVASVPRHGHVKLNSAGSITYKPRWDFVGTDAFRYEVTDSHGAKATARVTVRVVARLHSS